MASQWLFSALNVARRQLFTAGLESEARWMTKEALGYKTDAESFEFIELYLDMVLAPSPTADAPSDVE